MPTREPRALVGPWALVALLGCTPHAIRSDVARVEALADVQGLPALPSGRTDSAPSDDTRTLLAQPLDADAAVRVALLNNRTLRARLRQLGVERGMLIQAGLLANPFVEAEISPERNTRLELRAEYDVMSFVLMPLRKRAAKHDLDAARLSAAGDVVELGYTVRSAFYALQAAEQAFRFAEQGLDALAAGRDAAQALYDAGNLRALDASMHIAAYERARITVAKLELEVAERHEALARLLGLHGPSASFRVTPELAPVPEDAGLVDDAESRAIRANLDLSATRERLEAIAKRTGIARTEGLLRHLDVDVHGLVGNPESGGPTTVRLGGGVGVDVPLFDRNQGTLRVREAEFDSWLERYEGLAIDVRSSAREASARLASAHRRARQYQSVIVPAQRTVREQTLLQYNAMQVGVFQLLEARRAELEVALDYAETLRAYWSARAELEALCAGKRVGSSAGTPLQSFATSAPETGGH